MSLLYKATLQDVQFTSRPFPLLERYDERLLACSMKTEQVDLFYSRQLCEDRKGFLDHLHTKALFRSTTRICITQGANIFVQYMNDQLQEETKLDEQVARGKISQREADSELSEWTEREWKQRLNSFPKRFLIAIGKYQATVLVMRTYEYIVSKKSDKITLDKLTLDTFNYSQRAAKQGEQGRDLAKDIFQVSMKANLIAYLADFTVHQFILTLAYYAYIQQQRKNLKKLADSGPELHHGSLILSYSKNTVLLAISRGIGLILSSIGGAVGSLSWPGWGTLIGSNLGDGLAMAMGDEIISPSSPLG